MSHRQPEDEDQWRDPDDEGQDPEDWEDPDVSDQDNEDDSADTEACPHCGYPIYAQAERCPRCHSFVVMDVARRRPTWIIIGVILAIAAIGTWLFILWR